MGLDVPAVSAVLTDVWGLADLQVEPNDAGMNSRTWLVEARTARYVAKLVPADQHDRFVSGLAAAQLVESSGLPAGAPVTTLDGHSWMRVGRDTLALLTFVHGRPLIGEDPEEQQLIGLTLARAHRALTGRDVPGAARFHWIDPSAAHLDVESWVRPAILAALETWERLPPSSLTWGLLHSDPAPEAFLLRSDSGNSAVRIGPGHSSPPTWPKACYMRRRWIGRWSRCFGCDGPCKPTTSLSGSRRTTSPASPDRTRTSWALRTLAAASACDRHGRPIAHAREPLMGALVG